MIRSSGYRRLRLVNTWAVVVTGLCVVCLSGCERVSGFDPTALRLSKGALLIAICQDVDATGIGISIVRPGGEWADYWSADGEVKIDSGDVVNSLQPVQPWAPATGELSALAGTDIDIVIQSSASSPTAGVSSYFHLQTDLPSDRWLQVDGSLTERPCSQ